MHPCTRPASWMPHPRLMSLGGSLIGDFHCTERLAYHQAQPRAHSTTWPRAPHITLVRPLLSTCKPPLSDPLQHTHMHLTMGTLALSSYVCKKHSSIPANNRAAVVVVSLALYVLSSLINIPFIIAHDFVPIMIHATMKRRFQLTSGAYSNITSCSRKS